MPNSFKIDLDALSIAELLPPRPGSAVGAKISPIAVAGRPLKIVVGTRQKPVRILSEPSVFDKHSTTSRLNINYEILNPEHHAFPAL